MTLIKIILNLCYQNNPSDESLELVLNYLHYLVTFKSYHYAERDLELLFSAMRQLNKHRKLNFVALIQNSIRKTILKNGQLDHRGQTIVQANILKYKT